MDNVDNELPPQPTPPRAVTGIRKFAYLLISFVFLSLAMIGVALPGIPTTPFLLLMSYFLLRASPQLHNRVLKWPLVGKPLSDWHQHHGVQLNVKITAYVTVAIVIGLSLGLSPFNWIVKIVVVGSALLGVYIVYRLPTIREP